jgi:glycosyltransferase involved in cell wall biosynthesis
MVKITIDARMINHSGIGTYIRSLVPNLVNKYNLILLGDREILTKFNWSETVRIIDCRSSIYSVREQLEIPLKIPSCDIFICPHYNVPLLPVRAEKKIVLIHDVYHLAFSNQLSLPQKIYSRFLINYAVNHFDQIITISRFSESEIVRYTGIQREKLTVLYPGFDFKSVELNKDKEDAIRKKYGLPERFILFVGNIKPHKNLKNLLLAYKILLDKNIKIGMVATGKKEGFIVSDEGIKTIMNENKILADNVVFTGYIDGDQLPAIYKMADVFVFPSFYEGFGIPPIEAMAAGTPVIVSREASLPEVCGDAALYCDASAPEDIADKIEMILTDENLRNDLINKGTLNLTRFTKENFDQGWINIINKNK